MAIRNLGTGGNTVLSAAGLFVGAAATFIVIVAAQRIEAGPQSSESFSFEVASVKLHKPDGQLGFPQFLPGGRFRSSAVPLQVLIAFAYNLPLLPQSGRISGGPDWVRSEAGLYDIEARAPQGVIPPGLPVNVRDERMRSMLRSLLADRFHLKLRRETKELPIYALTVATTGSKLQESNIQEDSCKEGVICHQIRGGLGRGMDATAVSLSDVAAFVSNWTDRPVLDRTGVQTLFDIKTEGWAPMRTRPPRADGLPDPEGQTISDPIRPTLFQIFEKLGLRLQQQKGPVEMFIIESVERPTEN
jgi:uncharacterized protein (TIGR03435 family)